MMILRLPAQWAFFFHATRWYQPESAGRLHRRIKRTYRGTISSLYRAGERWRAGLIPLAAKSCARLATKTVLDLAEWVSHREIERRSIVRHADADSAHACCIT